MARVWSDTIGFNEKTFVEQLPHAAHRQKCHVVERFKLLMGQDAAGYVSGSEDPGAFILAWTGVQRWNRTNRGPDRGIQLCREQ